MSKLVCAGATLKCSYGTTPGQLAVLAGGKTDCASNLVATIQDHQPNVNVPPFGLCQSLANPQVAAATAAAKGVLTPQPCVPVIPAPWTPGSSSVAVKSVPALTADSKCTCQWAGVIEVTAPGQQAAEAG